MSFKKFAKVPLVKVASGTFDEKLNKVAFSGGSSLYSRDDNKLNIREMLAMVADEYNISREPTDYIYEAARAVTADVPNENGDAFPKNELLRFDHRLAKSVYQTFILKPHHINHRADNPKTARGVVLDATYNSSSPALEVCPACNSKTAAVEDRDEATGLSCKKCGEVVKDEFVELLIAIDTKKDPTFAEGVRTGALDSLSMGCEAGYTDCSICDNRARSASQFCSHIKSGKKQKHKTASGMKMSFEKCGEVVFTEISRVDQPADPTALQREIFTPDIPLKVESEMLLMAARIAKLEKVSEDTLVAPQTPFRTIGESIRWAEISASRLKGEITRLAAEKDERYKSAASEGRPFYAWESAQYDAQIKSAKQYVARLDEYVAKARELEASGEPWGKSLTRSMSRFFASKTGQADINDTLDELGRLHPDLYTDIVQNTNIDTGVAGPMSIGDYAKKLQDSGDHNVSPEEMGIKTDDSGAVSMPAVHEASKSIENKLASDMDAYNDLFEENTVGTAKSMKFSASYSNIVASTTKVGNIKIAMPNGSLFVIRPETKPLNADGSINKAAAEKIMAEVLASIGNDGLVDTLNKFNAIVNPKIGQVLQHHIEDFAHGREEGGKKAPTEDGLNDMAEKLGKPEKSLVSEEHSDRKDMKREKRDQSNADVLETHQPDHGDALPSKLTPATDESHSDMREERSSPSKNTLKDVAVDRKDLKPKTAKADDDKKKDDKSEGKKPDFLKKKEAEEMCANENCEMKGPHKTSEHKPKDDHEDDEAPKGDSGEESHSIEISMDELSDEDCTKLEEAIDEMFGVSLEKLSDMLNKKLQLSMNPEAQAAPAEPGGAPATMPGGAAVPPAAPGGGMPMTAAAKQYASRIERLYKARLDKLTKESEEKLASVKQEATKELQAKLFRAVNLAAKRQALNIEASPIKIHMFDTLSNELDLDDDSYYPGMDAVTATKLVEASVTNGYSDFVASIVRRAAEFMNLSDDAFNAIEADVKNLRPAPVAVATRQASRVASTDKSNAMRKQATEGNLLLASANDNEANVSKVDDRNNIRSALGTTKVSSTTRKLLTRK